MVRCVVGETDGFGLHQGSSLSIFLFAVGMDGWPDEVRPESL